MQSKTFGIYPWPDSLVNEGDKHQLLFKEALEYQGYTVKTIELNLIFPLSHALKKDVDVLVLDWVHSFYVSPSLVKTFVKSTLGLLELIFLKKQNTIIIWNLHNLHRHDKKFKRIEKICFRQLAKRVNYLRVFDESHKSKVADYLKVPLKKIITIPQGPYIYKQNVIVNINKRYKIPTKKKILLIFGSVRTGKGIDKFLRAFKQCNTTDFYLLIAGKANEVQLGQEIEIIVKGADNIIFDNRFIPDEEVQAYFTECDYVVLPYENTLNSGVLLLAKSNNSKLLANKNFVAYAQNNDKIGNLFAQKELQELLDKIILQKPSLSDEKFIKHSWESVVKKFEQVVNE